MSVLNAQSVGEKIISQGIFGSNILATRDHLGQGDTFDDVANTLGLQSLRYPGGSLIEHYFDLADPDRKTVTDINSNDQIDFYPIHSFYSMPKHRKKRHDCPSNAKIPITKHRYKRRPLCRN
jgi:tRNA A37 threonylcarbamoyltransferase TsaD